MAASLKSIVEYLEDKGLYEDVDKDLVKQLVFNTKLAEDCVKDINDNGYQIITNAGKTVMTAPAVNIYFQSVKTMQSISKILGISAKGRSELGIKDSEDSDGFGKY